MAVLDQTGFALSRFDVNEQLHWVFLVCYICDIFVIYSTFKQPRHRKFFQYRVLPIVLFIHVLAGCTELAAGFCALMSDYTAPRLITAIAALGFHIPTATLMAFQVCPVKVIERGTHRPSQGVGRLTSHDSLVPVRHCESRVLGCASDPGSGPAHGSRTNSLDGSRLRVRPGHLLLHGELQGHDGKSESEHTFSCLTHGAQDHKYTVSVVLAGVSLMPLIWGPVSVFYFLCYLIVYNGVAWIYGRLLYGTLNESKERRLSTDPAVPPPPVTDLIEPSDHLGRDRMLATFQVATRAPAVRLPAARGAVGVAGMDGAPDAALHDAAAEFDALRERVEETIAQYLREHPDALSRVTVHHKVYRPPAMATYDVVMQLRSRVSRWLLR